MARFNQPLSSPLKAKSFCAASFPLMFRGRLQTSVLIEAGSCFAAAMLADVRVGSFASILACPAMSGLWGIIGHGREPDRPSFHQPEPVPQLNRRRTRASSRSFLDEDHAGMLSARWAIDAIATGRCAAGREIYPLANDIPLIGASRTCAADGATSERCRQLQT